MMQYAEDTSQDGLIIALDQEKAYDKIKHDYLWRALREFEIPEDFISPIKSLYENAETKIMINGCLSQPWKITRGVRQGDPLSCLLFDLAIEPLAASIRASNLEGFNIPGSGERLITNLFADDTTVFMSKNDSFEDLTKILEEWCLASGAKFNTNKTEIIPIGTPTFRQQVITTRSTKTDPMAEKIPPNISIAQEGEATRILGAWFGNGIDAEGPWSIVLDKIETNLKRWDRSKPTLEGRRLIINMVVGGMTQYLTQVQGMPKKIETRISKTIRDFMWKDKRAPVSESTLFLKADEGGKALLDIAARNEAIEVMWSKRYLSLEMNRPLWALVADALFALKTPKSEKSVDKRVRLNIFLQSWKTASTERAGVCPDLRRILNIAKKYNLRPEGLAFSKDIVRQRPIWYHCDADTKIRKLNRGTSSECMKSKRDGINSVGQTETLAKLLENPNHRDNNYCACPECENMRSMVGCAHPHECAVRAKALIDTLPQKWDPRRAPIPHEQNTLEDTDQNPDEEWTTFKSHTITNGSLKDVFRIFTEGETIGTLPRTLSQSDDGPQVIAATDGSCTKNGQDNAFAGAGVFYNLNNEKNIKIKVPSHYKPSNQMAELLVLKEAAEHAPEVGCLHLELDSKYVIQNVTSRIRTHEDEGYTNTANEELLKLTIARLRDRKTTTRIKTEELTQLSTQL
ncbi:hypothetical protein D9615_009713 [Tricholomella constricta]|uniref:Reverse transcriptase domain-containing protein n=1 Tax=Tricholomella constricta TaxID=117010 RepID=A0A8H5GUD5_9AGAR|nr:hypothetical protein D9615_009713 [Tricholomella constricta]